MPKPHQLNPPPTDSELSTSETKRRVKRPGPTLVDSYSTNNLGARLCGLKHKVPPGEYAFYEVADAELEGCLYYERQRELQFLKGKEFLSDAASQGPRKSEPRFCDQTWFMLDPNDKAEYMRCAADEKRLSPEPVRLVSDLAPLQLRLMAIMPTMKRAELIFDLSHPNKRLESSFKRLLLRLRRTSGASTARMLVKETRGRKGMVKEKLMQLAVWRCRKAGLEPKEIIARLAAFRERFPVAADSTLAKKIADTVRKTEHWLLASPL